MPSNSTDGRRLGGPAARRATIARLAEHVSDAEAETLSDLLRFPFATAAQLQALNGRTSPSSDQERLAALRDEGAIDSLALPRATGRAPQLWHLTDLGLHIIADLCGVAPAPLARHAGVRGADLVASLRRLPELWATHEMLAATVEALRRGTPSGAPRPKLLGWSRPWRATVQRPDVPYREQWWIPASAWFGPRHAVRQYLLLPDLGRVGPRAWSRLLERALIWCSQQRIAGRAAPTLVVATDGGQQQRDWNVILAGVSPVAERILVTTWAAIAARDLALPTSFEGVPGHPGEWGDSSRHPLRRTPVFATSPRPNAVVRRIIDTRTGGPTDLRATLASLLGPLDWAILEAVGCHPFLPPPRLATALGTPLRGLRDRLHPLIDRGLIRVVDDVAPALIREAAAELADLPGAELRDAAADRVLLELTAAGMVAVLDWVGLPGDVGARWLGLVGNGPREPIGPRLSLLRHLTHTLGADAIVAR